MDIIQLNRKELLDYLTECSAPLMEVELLHVFFPSGFSKEQSLITKHLSLYHALYSLKTEAGYRGYYFHLDPMRIRVVELPKDGRCRHYFPETGRFCMKESYDENFCTDHLPLYAHVGRCPVPDALTEFYSDADSLMKLDQEMLERMMGAAARYTARRQEVEQAMELFGLSGVPSKRLICERYYRLARANHPDLIHGADDKMKIINRSYRVLLDVFHP